MSNLPENIYRHPQYTKRTMQVIAATMDEAAEAVLMDVHPETDSMDSYVARKQAADQLYEIADLARAAA